MMHDKINKKIESAMAGIDDISSAEPAPFLLTRIRATMSQTETRGTWYRIAMFIQRPAVAIASVLLLLLLNIAVLNSNRSSVKDSVAIRSISSPDDFAINISGIYDFETQEQ